MDWFEFQELMEDQWSDQSWAPNNPSIGVMVGHLESSPNLVVLSAKDLESR